MDARSLKRENERLEGVLAKLFGNVSVLMTVTVLVELDT